MFILGLILGFVCGVIFVPLFAGRIYTWFETGKWE